MTTVKRAPSRVRGTCERDCSAVAARAMIFILGLSSEGECLLATLLIRLGQNWARASPRTADASCKGHNYGEEGAVEFPAIASPARECAMCATGSSPSVALVRSPRIITFVVYNSEIAATTAATDALSQAPSLDHYFFMTRVKPVFIIRVSLVSNGANPRGP